MKYLSSIRAIALLAGVAGIVLSAGMQTAHAGGASAVSAPPGIVSMAAPGAAEVGVGDNAGGECANRIECDSWVRDQHKKLLMDLLSTYHAIGVGSVSGTPAQAEIVSVLAANVVAKR